MNAAPALAAGRDHQRRLHDLKQQIKAAPPAAAPPDRSHAQRTEALQRANVIRSLRAGLKRDLKARRVSIRDLILDPPDWLETAKLWDLIIACPKYGRVKTNKVFQQCRISPSKTFGGLSRRQRAEVAGLVRDTLAHHPQQEDLARAA